MEKIIQISDGMGTNCLTEDGKVYRWVQYWKNKSQKVFIPTKEEKEKGWEKISEWVEINECDKIKSYSKDEKKRLIEANELDD